MIGWMHRLAERVSSIPAVYELIQKLAGQDLVYRRILRMWTCGPGETVLDVGSSAGGLTARIAPSAICVDIDLTALLRARVKRPALRVVVADASRLPFFARSFDRTICVAVFHHLEANTAREAVREFARVTRSSLLFLDATRTGRWRSRLLWAFDRGQNARTSEQLRELLARDFNLEAETRFSVFHQYVIWNARPRTE